MSSYTDIFSNQSIQISQKFYEAITLSSNITLAWSTDFGSNPLVVASIMDISPTAGGFAVTMPDARHVSVGLSFSINNPTVNTFTLYANDGSTILSTVTGPSFRTLYLTNNTTANGTWRLIPFTGTSAVTSVAISTAGTSGNIVTSGSPITVSGTISLSLGNDLFGLTTFGNSIGIAVRTTSAGTWETTYLSGTTSQIVIDNATGVFASPTFKLASAISGIDSFQLSGGNLNIGVVANTIAANNANGPLILESQGTGSVDISAGTTGNIDLNVASSGQIRAYADIVLKNTGLVLQDSSLTNGITLFANGISTSYNLALPGSIGLASQVLGISTVVDGTAALTWLNAPTFSGFSVISTVPIFTSTAGALGDSTVTITGGSLNVMGDLSRVNLINGASAISLSLIGATNTIGSIVGDMFLTAPGGSHIGNLAPMYMLNSQPLYFSPNASGSQFVAFRSPALDTIIGNPIWTLPISDGGSGQFLRTNGAGTLSWASGAAGTVTSITQGTNMSFSVSPIVSTGTINLASVLTAITSIGVGNLILSGQTLQAGSGNLLFNTAGGSYIQHLSDAIMMSSKALTFSPTALGTDQFVGFKSPLVVTGNTIWKLPPADAAVVAPPQVLASDGATNLSWVSVGSVTSITATSPNLTGGTITTSGTIGLNPVLTGLTSAVIGTYTIAGTSITSSGVSTLQTTGVMTLNATTAISLGNGTAGVVPLRFYKSNGANYTSLQAPAGTGAPNVALTLPNADGVANQALTTNGAAGVLSFGTTLRTIPAASSNPGTLVLGTAFQNTLAFDVMAIVYLNVTSNVSGVILCGVGPTTTPTQQTIVTGSTLASVITVPVYLPSQYYLLLSTTGTITVTPMSTQFTPV